MTRVTSDVVEEVDLAKSYRASRPGDNFGFYPEYHGKPMEDSEQRDDMVKLLFLKDTQSAVMGKGVTVAEV